ncbi:acetyl-CoA C-acyltransferase [Staphylococcus felis]|uniref:thiolase family protein n=1 Tax=Staphylococcus felis TaxID=46127 RepID=UPI000E25285C|nr:thiolase family protein [Staphylococcus felis]REI09165.1 acetyl-CoA C-acyltransferase [Staphylococcus felis]
MRVILAEAFRTPIGSLGGAFKDVRATDLGATLIQHIIQRHPSLVEKIDEVIIGNVLQAGQGQNPARIAAVKGGLPYNVPAFTVNKVCGSGLKAIQLAYQSIITGDQEVVLAGGMENMSQSPLLMTTGRFGFKMGNQMLIDSMISDGLTDAFHHYHMGITAENVAAHYNVSRIEQDKFALESQKKASLSNQTGAFKEEIVPVEVSRAKEKSEYINQDEGIRKGITLEKLQKLNPVFQRDGSVTAGNASSINDGAAMMLVMTEEKAKALGIKPLAVIECITTAGVDPKVMGIGPIPAIQKALSHAELNISDIDVFELNEAFAAQSLAVSQELRIPSERLNPKGGAIALGHPIGASGARILVTLLHQLSNEMRQGLAALCIGGGQGIATIVTHYKG